LAIVGNCWHNAARVEKFGMRKIWTVLIAVSLGLALGACSKCEIPDLLPKMCKTGTGTGSGAGTGTGTNLSFLQ
jgi:hypothetical protein